MNSFIIATDSTSDLSEDFLKANDISVAYLTYTMEGVSYSKDNQLPVHDFYEKMRAGALPITSQINPEEAKIFLEELTEKSKQILYIAFSSGISGTFNSVRLAAEEIMEEKADVKIEVVDSMSASAGEGLLVYYACKLRAEGKSFEETAHWVKEHRLNFVHMFTVDDLNHLYRGGRVSKSSAVVGTVLNIKPILHVDDEGHLVPVGKVRGRKKALDALLDYMGEKMGSYKDSNDMVFISHGDSLEDAEYVKEEAVRRFGIKECVITPIDPTIGSHSGPGTIALFFLGDVR